MKNSEFGGRKRINFSDLQTRNGVTRTGMTGANEPIIRNTLGATRSELQQRYLAQNNVSAKRFVFNITRETYTIPLPLPFALFCPVAVANSYRTVFSQTGTTPAGGTVEVSYNNAGAMEIAWTVGANTDIITVQKKGLVPYVDFMEILKTGFFSTLGFKYFGPTTNFLLQFQEYELSWGSVTMQGRTTQDSDDVESFLSEDNFIEYMLPIEISNVFDQARYVVNGFPDTPAVPATPTQLTMAFITTAYGSFVSMGNAFDCE